MRYETRHWPTTPFAVERQDPSFPENFAFVTRRILFVGVNLVGGFVHDPSEWSARHAANLQWIDDQINTHRADIDMLVVFAHSDPVVASNDPFFRTFVERVRNRYGGSLVTLLIHRNMGIENWGIERNYDGVGHLDRIIVEGAVWPPMRLELTSRGIQSMNQNAWM